MFDMHKLHHFRTLARTGSFNSAAAELNLTQPSLSRSIQALEKQYGVQLLERQRGRLGIQLTQSGHQVLRFADQLLNMGDSMERELTGRTHERHPTLAFGLGPMLASATLDRLLDHLHAQYPGLDATVVIDATSVMYPRLLNGELEFYIGQSFGQRTSSRVLHTPFAYTPPRFYVRQGHPLIERSSIPIEDLKSYPRIAGTAWNDSLSRLPSDQVAAVRATLRLDNYDILARIAASSDAVLISPHVRESTGLTAIPVEFAPQHELHQVDMYCLEGIGMSPVARSALQRLKELVDELMAGIH
ncbi:LysR family transcriptional regulator [Rhodococcus sp. MALMAid1271]|uniref:LysR family transcriptional regulator n=1 Tax=Rhodococcus sp. MALMAid1271 TaxID=3411744 RepID=UPI003BA26818